MPDRSNLDSIDVIPLFTNLPLEETILRSSYIKQIYGNKHCHSKTNIERSMISFHKNAHFTLNNKVYIQVDRISIGSPLENIFMIELQRVVKPTSVKEVKQCKRYVGDKFKTPNRINKTV